MPCRHLHQAPLLINTTDSYPCPSDPLPSKLSRPQQTCLSSRSECDFPSPLRVDVINGWP